jgi:nitroreductase
MSTTDEALKLVQEALEEIALAGMSGTGQESEEAMTAWHARQAWKFIGIAARALEPIKQALAAPVHPIDGLHAVIRANATRQAEWDAKTPEERWAYHQENACPHCGGSGHKDDISPPATPAPLTDDRCRAAFDAWYSSAPDAPEEPERSYELTDESMSELTKECIWLGWQAAHGITKGGAA